MHKSLVILCLEPWIIFYFVFFWPNFASHKRFVRGMRARVFRVHSFFRQFELQFACSLSKKWVLINGINIIAMPVQHQNFINDPLAVRSSCFCFRLHTLMIHVWLSVRFGNCVAKLHHGETRLHIWIATVLHFCLCASTERTTNTDIRLDLNRRHFHLHSWQLTI